MPVIAFIAINFEDTYEQLSQIQKIQSESKENVIRSKDNDREVECQHSFHETGSKASLHIEISVIAFSSPLEKSALLERIKLAD